MKTKSLKITSSNPFLLENIAKGLICAIRGRNYRARLLPLSKFVKSVDDNTYEDDNYANSIIYQIRGGFRYETISGREITYKRGESLEIDFGEEGSYNFASFCEDAIKNASVNVNREETEKGSYYTFNCPSCGLEDHMEGDYGYSFVDPSHQKDCYKINKKQIKDDGNGN